MTIKQKPFWYKILEQSSFLDNAAVLPYECFWTNEQRNIFYGHFTRKITTLYLNFMSIDRKQYEESVIYALEQTFESLHVQALAENLSLAKGLITK